tara:strand:- start:237 stop:482 length:246 start_codon:yes stop_codon:yes gene_type:complete
MSFIEQEASIKYEMINGRKTPVIKPKIEVTLKNKKTGTEYESDAAAMIDVQDPKTETKPEDIQRDVKIHVAAIPVGGKSNL